MTHYTLLVIIVQFSELMKIDKKVTLRGQDVKSAVQLIVPEMDVHGLSSRAVEKGEKALRDFMASK